MIEIVLAIVSVLLFAVIVVAGVLYRLFRAANDTIVLRERAIEGYADQIEREQKNNAQLDKQLAVAKQTEADFEQRLKESQTRFQDALKKTDATSQQAFKALAGDTLKQATDQFLKLAEQNFATKQKGAAAELDQRKTAIEALIKPINEKLRDATRALTDIEKSRKQAYGSLTQQLGFMLDDQKNLRDETANLVKALRRPEVRGQWGELQLERVAELAGMKSHCDFETQAHVTTDAGGLRPDMIVKLPGGREIVVDAKTPIAAFIDAAEATQDDTREDAMRRHVRHIEEKVTELSSKRYQDHFNTADFVVLFIPGESFLYAAAQRKPGLIESAMNRNVVIATPTTLVSLLKVVALGWREEQVADNAQKICDIGQELHKRVATATAHLSNLGKAVGKTVEHYNKFVTSFESRVVTQARRFEDLGAAAPDKKLPVEGEITIVESIPREAKQLAPQNDSDEHE